MQNSITLISFELNDKNLADAWKKCLMKLLKACKVLTDLSTVIQL